jgi:hypothetical protein
MAQITERSIRQIKTKHVAKEDIHCWRFDTFIRKLRYCHCITNQPIGSHDQD